MEEKVVTIPNINCEHCVRTIEREIEDLPGVTRVEASEKTREARIQWLPPANWESIRRLLEEINYPPEES